MWRKYFKTVKNFKLDKIGYYEALTQTYDEVPSESFKITTEYFLACPNFKSERCFLW